MTDEPTSTPEDDAVEAEEVDPDFASDPVDPDDEVEDDG